VAYSAQPFHLVGLNALLCGDQSHSGPRRFVEGNVMSDGWPMKKERELIELARKKHIAEQIANKLEAPLPQIFKVARRLGVDLGPQPPKLDRRLGPRAK
jgi:hypothetical protein